MQFAVIRRAMTSVIAPLFFFVACGDATAPAAASLATAGGGIRRRAAEAWERLGPTLRVFALLG